MRPIGHFPFKEAVVIPWVIFLFKKTLVIPMG